MTCRPPDDAAQVLVLSLDKGQPGESTSVATYVTSRSPVVEAKGAGLNVSLGGHYDGANPSQSYLRYAYGETSEDFSAWFLQNKAKLKQEREREMVRRVCNT